MVMDPKLLSEVIEPLVTNTRSFSPIGMSWTTPLLSVVNEFTMIDSESAPKPNLVTSVPNRNSTPLPRSQLTIGSAIASYWL